MLTSRMMSRPGDGKYASWVILISKNVDKVLEKKY